MDRAFCRLVFRKHIELATRGIVGRGKAAEGGRDNGLEESGNLGRRAEGGGGGGGGSGLVAPEEGRTGGRLFPPPLGFL